MNAPPAGTPNGPAATGTMTKVTLEVDDIQAPLLHPRPTRYAGAVILVRIDDRRDGRELLRRLIPFVPSAAGPLDPDQEGLGRRGAQLPGPQGAGRAGGRPSPASRRSFSRAWPRGRAELGDTGESAPEHWEPPLGGPDVHLAIYALAPDAARLEATLAGARDALREVPGVAPIWQQDTYMLPTERTSFGFKDGISNPAIEGSGIPGTNPHEEPFKAGEFVLGYPNENGDLPPTPEPEVLGRNGSYVVFRKLQTRVAEFRQYVRARAKSRDEEELLAAKFVGRWPSGAPLVLAPERDDPELGADPGAEQRLPLRRGRRARPQVPARRPRPSEQRTRREDHRRSAECTGSSGAAPATARCCPRASSKTTGPIAASCSSASRRSSPRQFEFVKTEWINDGHLLSARPARWTRWSGRTTGPAGSPSPSSRSAGA